MYKIQPFFITIRFGANSQRHSDTVRSLSDASQSPFAQGRHLEFAVYKWLSVEFESRLFSTFLQKKPDKTGLVNGQRNC